MTSDSLSIFNSLANNNNLRVMPNIDINVKDVEDDFAGEYLFGHAV